jgi:type III pantothenate kinase
MILLIDVGNSRIKWVGINSNNLTQIIIANRADQIAINHRGNTLTILENIIQTFLPIQKIFMVHVLGEVFDTKVKQLATQYSIPLQLIYSQSRAYGISTHYVQASKLGADRFVAMLAAYQSRKNKACIVIDCGTAITIDTVNRFGEHIGGVILPGLSLCKESLNKKAKNLQKIGEPSQVDQPTMLDKTTLFATDTQYGIQSGCYYGLAGAIKDICQKMEKTLIKCDIHSTKINKIICGGDAKAFYPLLSSYQLKADLVMDGLVYIAAETVKP